MMYIHGPYATHSHPSITSSLNEEKYNNDNNDNNDNDNKKY